MWAGAKRLPLISWLLSLTGVVCISFRGACPSLVSLTDRSCIMLHIVMPKHKHTHMHRHTLTHIVPWLRSIRRTVLLTSTLGQRFVCVCVYAVPVLFTVSLLSPPPPCICGLLDSIDKHLDARG